MTRTCRARLSRHWRDQFASGKLYCYSLRVEPLILTCSEARQHVQVLRPFLTEVRAEGGRSKMTTHNIAETQFS